jgi:hypothetical protein
MRILDRLTHAFAAGIYLGIAALTLAPGRPRGALRDQRRPHADALERRHQAPAYRHRYRLFGDDFDRVGRNVLIALGVQGRYDRPFGSSPVRKNAEYAFLRLRYKLPGEGESRLIERPVTAGDGYAALDRAPAETRFAVAVAAFGQLLRGDPYLEGYGYDDVIALAQPARGADEYGYRAEFVQLVRLADGAQAQAALP